MFERVNVKGNKGWGNSNVYDKGSYKVYYKDAVCLLQFFYH